MASNGFRPALLFLSSSGVTPPPRSQRESSPTAPDDRWLRADRPSLTRLASVYRHRKIPADPSSPLRIKISRIRFAQLGRSSYFSRCPLLIPVAKIVLQHISRGERTFGSAASCQKPS